MKRSMLAVGVIAAIGMMFSCNRQGSEENEMTFESYSYKIIAVDGETDAMQTIDGSGILPVAGKNPALIQLRDSLEKLAGVKFTEGKAEPRLDPGFKVTGLNGDYEETVNFHSDWLTIVLATPKVVVWEDFISDYQGGAHGMEGLSYINYSIEERKILTLHDLIERRSLNTVRNLLLDTLKDREDLLTDLQEINVPEEFRITTRGIEFVWQEYEIAPYSSGFVSVELQKYQLEPYLTPQGKRIFGL